MAGNLILVLVGEEGRSKVKSPECSRVMYGQDA